MSQQHANLLHKIEQQHKIIGYLQQQHLQNTGYPVALPQTWQDFLKISPSQAPIIEPNASKNAEYSIEKRENAETFLQALANLGLPSKLPETSKKNSNKSRDFAMSVGKKSVQMTNFNPSNPLHMIETINLSNFVNRKFSKAGFRELVESISDMRCLSTVVLQNNGISESYQEELEALLLNKRIVNLDLSRNNIDKTCIMRLSKIMKENITHLEWIDLSRNDFSHDLPALNSLITGLKCQKNLFHLALDANTKYTAPPPPNTDKKYVGAESIARLSQRLRSLSLLDSKLTPDAMKFIEQSLQSPSNHLISLNFQFCFLDSHCLHILSKGVAANRTLIKLDLSNNGLAPISGIYLTKSLADNITLHELNLAKNNLNDDFAGTLAETLRRNDVLWKVDISFNPIGFHGAEALISALKEENDTLESLGNVEVNTQMGINNIQQLKKHLKINELSKDLKRKFIEDRKNLLGAEPQSLSFSKQNESFSQASYADRFESEGFRLLKPVIFTNNAYNDGTNFRLWNI